MLNGLLALSQRGTVAGDADNTCSGDFAARPETSLAWATDATFGVLSTVGPEGRLAISAATATLAAMAPPAENLSQP
jgi:hypothetical protein